MSIPKIDWKVVMAVLVALVIAYAFKTYVWGSFMADDSNSEVSGFTGTKFSRAA